jgi:hypothetical protein
VVLPSEFPGRSYELGSLRKAFAEVLDSLELASLGETSLGARKVTNGLADESRRQPQRLADRIPRSDSQLHSI